MPPIAAAIGGENRKACFAVALEEASRDPAAEAVRRAIIEAPRNPPTDFTAHQGWVLIALQNAFFRLLNSRSAEAGIIETVAEGGDTDTNAAIAGALLGAYYGRATLPWRWINAVLTCRPLAESGAAKPRPRLYWPVDTLSIAEELLTLGAATKGK